MKRGSKIRLDSPEQTELLGFNFGKTLPPNSTVALFGDLGAGKTTFVKGLAHASTKVSPFEVSSPTFTYLNIYEGEIPLYHFDLYRLKTSDDFFGLGFDEYFQAGGICCIEWPEIISSYLPPGTILIEIEYSGQNRREVTLS